MNIPEYLASLVHLPEKFGPDKRWSARALSGELGHGQTADEAIENMVHNVKNKEALQRLKDETAP